jgi:hypothetical protein
MKKLFQYTLLLVLTIAVGCYQEHKTKYLRAYNEAELNELIKPGMTFEDMTNTFGPPGSEIQTTGDMTTITYLFSPKSTPLKVGPYLAGFDVEVKKGHVVRWIPLRGTMSGPFAGPNTQTALSGEETFAIFIQSDGSTNAENFLRSESGMSVGDLKTPPDLTIRAKFSIDEGNGNSADKTVFLTIDDRDVPKLKSLTETNYGNRVMIACRDKVIAAPIISGPIDVNHFFFKIKDSIVSDVFGKQ